MKSFAIWLIVFISFSAHAQTWAPVGAKWYYSKVDLPHSIGFEVFESLRDTVVQGKLARIIEIRSVGITSNKDTGSYVKSNEIMYEDSQRVYHLAFGSFRLLYDFNLLPGDTYKIMQRGSIITGDSTLSIIVDSVSIKNVNSIPLKHLYVHPIKKSWDFYGPIIERLGCSSYMFPYYDWTNPTDGGSLRCYSDTIVGLHKISSTECDYLKKFSGLPSQADNQTPFLIYSDPANGKIIVRTKYSWLSSYQRKITIVVTNSQGSQIISNTTLIINQINIDLPQVSPGIYLIKLISDNKVYTKRLYIK